MMRPEYIPAPPSPVKVGRPLVGDAQRIAALRLVAALSSALSAI
jgi:hypothetical protein